VISFGLVLWRIIRRMAVSGGGGDGAVRVWDLAQAAAPRVLTGHDGWVRAVAVSAGGRMAVSGGGGAVRVWDLTCHREQARWIADGDVLYWPSPSIAPSPWSATRPGQLHVLQLNVPVAASV
jgi:WD40 repeat protein